MIGANVIGANVIGALRQLAREQDEGALLTIEPGRTRDRFECLYSTLVA